MYTVCLIVMYSCSSQLVFYEFFLKTRAGLATLCETLTLEIDAIISGNATGYPIFGHKTESDSCDSCCKVYIFGISQSGIQPVYVLYRTERLHKNRLCSVENYFVSKFGAVDALESRLCNKYFAENYEICYSQVAGSRICHLSLQ